MSNPNTPNKNPKKKMIIALSAIAVVVAIVVAAATLVDPPMFQGAIRSITPVVVVTDTDPIVKDSTILDTKIVTEPAIIEEEPDVKLETELKTDPVIVADPVEKTDEPTEIAPIVKEGVQATPPKISLAYLDRLDPLDPNSQSIYGTITPGINQAQLIFRVRNTGTMSAYLKSFDTREYGCGGASSCYLATTDGRLQRISYDNSGYLDDSLFVGNLIEVGNINPKDNLPDGTYVMSFKGTDPINNSLLEIPGLSDTYFAVKKSTTDYFYSGSAVSRFAQAFIDLATFKVVDSNDVELSLSIDSADSAPVGIMIYYNPFFI